MRRAIAIAVLLAGAALPLPATAKEGVRAHLDVPFDIDTPAGQMVTVRFHLRDADGHRFGGGGIYLRVSRCGRKPLRVRATEAGQSYSARFRVPKPRIRKLMVGLPGRRTYAGGRTERADAFFQFDPVLYSRRDCR